MSNPFGIGITNLKAPVSDDSRRNRTIAWSQQLIVGIPKVDYQVFNHITSLLPPLLSMDSFRQIKHCKTKCPKSQSQAWNQH